MLKLQYLRNHSFLYGVYHMTKFVFKLSYVRPLQGMDRLSGHPVQ